MTSDPRAALDRLVAALEAHLAAVERRVGESDPVVARAHQALADAFEIYDESLYTAYDEVTPFVLYTADEDDDEFDEDLDELEDDEDDDEDLDDDLDDDEDLEDDEIDDDLDDDETDDLDRSQRRSG